MSFKATFNTNQHFAVSFSHQEELSAEFGAHIVIPIADYYEGDYTVTPKAYEAQTLETQGLAMRDDVTVFEIPYVEVSNPVGGKTVTIGGI